jgi:hypothetical protein
MAGAAARQRFPSTAAIAVSGILAIAWLLAQVIVSIYLAGQAGSPRPDNWDAMERILDVITVGVLPTLLLVVLTPMAWFGARDGARWAAFHPILLTLICVAQLIPCFREWANLPPAREPPLVLCWPHGMSPAPMDAHAYDVKAGDLVTIQSLPEVYNAALKGPGQAAQLRAWIGRTVTVTRIGKDGGIWFTPIGLPPTGEAVQFCLRRGDVIRVPTQR